MSIIDRKTKHCPTCDITKSINQFYKNRGRPDGREGICKECRKAKAAERRKAPEYQEYQRQWWQEKGKYKKYHWSPEARKKRAEYDQWYRKTKRGKEVRQGIDTRKREKEYVQQQEAAHRAIRDEVRSGRWPKASELPCFKCNEPADHYHHINGYDWENWYDAIPLCAKCHTWEHGDF